MTCNEVISYYSCLLRDYMFHKVSNGCFQKGGQKKRKHDRIFTISWQQSAFGWQKVCRFPCNWWFLWCSLELDQTFYSKKISGRARLSGSCVGFALFIYCIQFAIHLTCVALYIIIGSPKCHKTRHRPNWGPCQRTFTTGLSVDRVLSPTR